MDLVIFKFNNLIYKKCTIKGAKIRHSGLYKIFLIILTLKY